MKHHCIARQVGLGWVGLLTNNEAVKVHLMPVQRNRVILELHACAHG